MDRRIFVENEDHPLIPDHSEKCRILTYRRTQKIFKAFKDAIKTEKARRELCQKNYHKIFSRQNHRLKTKALKEWKDRSRRRMAIYSGLATFKNVFTKIYKFNSFDSRKTAMKDLVEYTRYIRRQEHRYRIAESNSKLLRKRFILNLLKINHSKAKSQKKGFSKLSTILAALKYKDRFIETLKNLHHRDQLLSKIITRKYQKERRRALIRHFRQLKASVKRYRVQMSKAKIHQKKQKKRLKQEIFYSWRQLIARKKGISQKGSQLRKIKESRLITEYLQKWKFEVIENQGSIHNRQRILQQAMRKLHILRVLDQLREYKEESQSYKKEVAQCLVVIDKWLCKKNKLVAFRRLQGYIEDLDRCEFFVENLVKVCDRSDRGYASVVFFGELKRIMGSGRLLEAYTWRKDLEKKKQIFGVWRKLGILNQRLLPSFEQSREQTLGRWIFLAWKQTSLESENSLFTRQKETERRLVELRLKRVIGVLKLNKERGHFRRLRFKKRFRGMLGLLEEASLEKVRAAFDRLGQFRNLRAGFELTSRALVRGRVRSSFLCLVQKMRSEQLGDQKVAYFRSKLYYKTAKKS